MAHTYEELKKKTIADLREIAKDIQHEAVQGYTQMNKDHLLREIKAKRTAALEKGDRELVAQLRQQHRRLNHILRTSAKRAILH